MAITYKWSFLNFEVDSLETENTDIKARLNTPEGN